MHFFFIFFIFCVLLSVSVVHTSSPCTEIRPRGYTDMQKGLNEEHVNLSSLKDAETYLHHFHWYDEHLKESIEFLKTATFPKDGLSPERIRSQVVKHWNAILCQLTLEQQQDRLFQNTLTIALENFILSQVHERLFHELCLAYKEEDLFIWNHCLSLTNQNFSAEKLGIPQGFGIYFPSAVVELAALDCQQCPLDKLNCLRTTLDYVHADIKCAIADMHVSTPGEALTPNITSKDIVPILAAVLAQSKPPHLASNLHYIESYQVTLSPSDPLCSGLVTFQQALGHLLSIKLDSNQEIEVPQIGRGLSKEIQLEDLAKLTNYDEKNDDEAKQITPLDCQLKRMASLIEMATKESKH